MTKISVEDTHFHLKNTIQTGNKLVSLSKPKVMGIINCTPDSFYSGSRFSLPDTILSHSQKLINEGASILDIGGYSTRPGADPVSKEEEANRVVQAISLIRSHFPEIILSADTFRSDVAEAALKAGADLINDISGGTIDPEIIEVAATLKVPYILMHFHGSLETMHTVPAYPSFFNDVVRYLSEKINFLHKKGVYDVIIDPGFGFSKSMEQNFELLDKLQDLQLLGQPILAGLSRKRMIWSTLNSTPEEALNGTTVLNTIAVLKGAKILRVHDVKEAKEIIDLVYS